MVEDNGQMTVSTNAAKRSRWRFSSAIMLGALMPMSLVPTGCAATDDYAEVQSPPQPSESPAIVEQALPEATRLALQTCAKEHAAKLSKHSYEIAFELEVTDTGEIDEIKTKGNRLDHTELETCMTDALKVLSVGDYLRPSDSLTSPAEPQSISSSSRALLGTTALLPQAIRLAPIVIAAPGGVIIVVAVVIVVAVAVLLPKSPKRSKDECDEEEKWATENCAKWLAKPNPHVEVVGPSKTMEESIFNNVSEDCGGKPRDWVSPGRPGRRF